MGPNADDHTSQASRQEALRRRALGPVLGGVLTAVSVYGLIGMVWGWVVATAARVYMPGGLMRSCRASIPISYLPNRNKQPEITITCSP